MDLLGAESKKRLLHEEEEGGSMAFCSNTCWLDALPPFRYVTEEASTMAYLEDISGLEDLLCSFPADVSLQQGRQLRVSLICLQLCNIHNLVYWLPILRAEIGIEHMARDTGMPPC